MLRSRSLLAILGAGLVTLAPLDARAEGTTWLPGAARAIPRTTTASRDAAVLEYAYGPRAQGSIGAEPGVVAWDRSATRLTLGVYALAALENATSYRPFPPGELWRGLIGASLALELPRLARGWLVPGSDLEVALVVGHESDHVTAYSTVSLPPAGARDIPFGGGGDFVAPDVTVRLPAGRAVTITVRLQDRIYFNSLPLLVGARVASDTVADTLHEGLANAPGADVVVRWKASTWAVPSLALFAEHLVAHDSFAADGGFFRALAGVAFPGRVGEVEPFVSFDAGNGKGMLVNDREARLSLGVRYAPF